MKQSKNRKTESENITVFTYTAPEAASAADELHEEGCDIPMQDGDFADGKNNSRQLDDMEQTAAPSDETPEESVFISCEPLLEQDLQEDAPRRDEVDRDALRRIFNEGETEGEAVIDSVNYSAEEDDSKSDNNDDFDIVDSIAEIIANKVFNGDDPLHNTNAAEEIDPQQRYEEQSFTAGFNVLAEYDFTAEESAPSKKSIYDEYDEISGKVITAREDAEKRAEAAARHGFPKAEVKDVPPRVTAPPVLSKLVLTADGDNPEVLKLREDDFAEEDPSEQTAAEREEAPEKKRTTRFDYEHLLIEVQEHMSNTHQSLFVSDSLSEGDIHLIRDFILRYLIVEDITVSGMGTKEELAEKLLQDMVGFSFVSKLLEDADEMGLEEIDINAWNDIELIFANGRRKHDERFISPQHALDVVRRMLQVSDTIIDEAKPMALGSLAKNIRITVLKTPVLDEDVGISASIRIVRSAKLSRQNLEHNTATGDMLDLLALAVRYGVGICVAGNTGSGKTSTVGWLLSTVPDQKRIYTIEEGSREFDLVRRDEKGNITNSVIHTLTKPSLNEDNNIDQESLLDYALRFHPDIICVGEMRSREAFAAQEAARTGHTVITTIHSKSAVGAYYRMTTLAKRAHDFSDDTLLRLMVEAFPLVIYQRQLEDSSRKITEIIEGERFENGQIIYRTLFRYIVDDNGVVDGQTVVNGHFEHSSAISWQLAQELLQNGANKNEVDRFFNVKTDTSGEKLLNIAMHNEVRTL